MKLLNSSEVLDSFTPRHTPAPSPQCLGWGPVGGLVLAAPPAVGLPLAHLAPHPPLGAVMGRAGYSDGGVFLEKRPNSLKLLLQLMDKHNKSWHLPSPYYTLGVELGMESAGHHVNFTV